MQTYSTGRRCPVKATHNTMSHSHTYIERYTLLQFGYIHAWQWYCVCMHAHPIAYVVGHAGGNQFEHLSHRQEVGVLFRGNMLILESDHVLEDLEYLLHAGKAVLARRQGGQRGLGLYARSKEATSARCKNAACHTRTRIYRLVGL